MCQRRIKLFKSLKLDSIGLKSGEYGGKKRRSKPALSHISCKDSSTCHDALSITRIDRGAGYGLQQGIRSFLIKSSNISCVQVPWNVIEAMYLSIVYAGRHDVRALD